MTLPASDLVITNSLIKSFKGCENATKYKHVEEIGPKLNRAKPLTRGTWFHALLEAKYKGMAGLETPTVTEVHKAEVAKYGKMFDEEKEALGDLPHEMADLYKAYNWHYQRDDSWKIHEVEIKLEAELPNGMQGQGKSDLLVEDDAGLWVVDHKTHKSLPRWDYRLLDYQSPYYIWLFRQCGIPVRGFIWNYVVPKSPQPLNFGVRDGRLLKKQPAFTDYPTAYKSAKAAGMLDDPPTQAYLAMLKDRQYDVDRVQVSPVFRRDLIEKNDTMLATVMDDITRTADRYGEWRAALERDPEAPVSRNVGRNCDWCSYRSLCVAELMGLDADGVRHREFQKRDPFAYYKTDDEKEA
ncbi:Cas4 family exonuclease [Gordonia phage Vine]|uniref:Cas4 family exonuclease n=1 Tax=Gordonia phage Vine TaxID=2857501 RepID=A0AAE8BV96_9CAUD|nr:exonuclease [Gordonia phage Vine]QZD97754.1 Cas4 family exonuclease [Gordonia phage Vine]